MVLGLCIVVGILVFFLTLPFITYMLPRWLSLLAGTMFGKGKINITIQRTEYAPGDIISGDVALTLKKPVNAREVSISLIGERIPLGSWHGSKTKMTTWTRGGGKKTLTETKSSTEIYNFKQPLDSEKEYSQGREYRFEIKIPADILGPKREGTLGQALKVVGVVFAVVAAFTSGEIHLPTKWYLLAKFDIPRGPDIWKKVAVKIR